MSRLLRYFLLLAVLALPVGTVFGQSFKTHKVKKQETIYGIAHENGLTEEQLRAANPGMESPDFVLKKGDIIRVPLLTTGVNGDVRQRDIRVGVLLPLHNQDNDGRRMLEYYRGVLMACDELKKEGISVTIRAWNLPEDGSLQTFLNDPNATKLDLIIGPFYEKYVTPLANFASSYGIMMLIPYSIHTVEIYSNPHVFQIYQNHEDLNESTARRFAGWFRTSHPIIIDGGDPQSTKGAFTSILRNQLTEAGIQYNLTSLKTADNEFARAFASNMPNIVVLNTASPTALQAAFSKLHTLKANYPGVDISVFGYMEWMPYTNQYLQNFHKYNVYLPAPFYTNLDRPLARSLEVKYLQNFHQDMINILPRFALTGFDHATFFLRGLHKFGASFDGAAGSLQYEPAQTPLRFERIGVGGYQNRSYMFVHYKPDGTIETITY